MHLRQANRTTASFLAALVVVVGGASSGFASVARSVPFDDKVDQADSIILGRCVATRSGYDPTHRWILTTATFQVEKSIKGSVGQTTEVVVPGGTVDGIHQETVGVPSFNAGDERVLFVKRGKLGPSVLYYGQGDYTVEKDAQGRRSVRPNVDDLILLDSQTGKISANETLRSLDNFEREVSLASQRVQARRLNQSAVSSARSTPRSWQHDLGDFFHENRLVLIILLAGALIALIPLLKRS
ncbi:MAG: hypothetical protein ABI718_07555 [Acidobacteriota bacterium]